MFDNAFEKFTAMDAVNAGLLEAINSGDTKIEVRIELYNGELIFDQKVFCFVDKNGKLRAGRFKDDSELVAFFMLFYPDDDDEEIQEKSFPVLKDKKLASVVENILKKNGKV